MLRLESQEQCNLQDGNGVRRSTKTAMEWSGSLLCAQITILVRSEYPNYYTGKDIPAGATRIGDVHGHTGINSPDKGMHMSPGDLGNAGTMLNVHGRKLRTWLIPRDKYGNSILLRMRSPSCCLGEFNNAKQSTWKIRGDIDPSCVRCVLLHCVLQASFG